MTETQRYSIFTIWACNGVDATISRMRKWNRENANLGAYPPEAFELIERLRGRKVDGHLPRNWRTI